MGNYDLEEQRVIEKINTGTYTKVLLQLPDGLKPEAWELVKKLEGATGATIFVWFGTNFGACDLPLGVQSLGVQLVVAFGHNQYIKDVRGW
ncbi:hypothetical protein J4419_04825 [Candidatus Woesearchaeota archaeon]|nr:hypothetical protein [Candidatus Woesearchaeota archaeon]